jgi:hypothetical protein
MPNKPHENTLHFINRHVHILDYTSVKHPCSNISSTPFLLEVSKTLQNDAFAMSETVSDVWQIVMRVVGMHVRFS